MSDNSIPDEWYFITPPQSVNWEKQSKSKITDTYGTNNPYVNYGSTGLRTLSLGDAMIEGFSDAKEVEGNITQLESCMRMVIDEGKGFTAPYCWHVFAGDKSYGTYIINSVSVEESMRDMSGKATRATVSVEFQEVPPYQVTSGIDITTTAVLGGITPEAERNFAAMANQDAAVANSKSVGGKNSTGQTVGGARPGANASTPGGGGSPDATNPGPAYARGKAGSSELSLNYIALPSE